GCGASGTSEGISTGDGAPPPVNEASPGGGDGLDGGVSSEPDGMGDATPHDLPDGGGASTFRVHLRGAVQKGPFLAGSPVVVSPLDARAEPAGPSSTTSTLDDLGRFELDFDATAL